MNTKIFQKSFLIRIASFVSIMSTGITWTGLGYTLAAFYGDSRYLGLMQILSIITSLLGPHLAIFLQKNISIRKTLIGADVLSAICYLTIFLLIIYNIKILISPISIVFFATVSMLALAVQAVYFEPLYAKITSDENLSLTDLTSQFSKLGSYMTLGKLIGMGCGPLLFEFLGFKAIFINFLTFFISGILIALGILHSSSVESISDQIKNNKIIGFRKSSWKFLTNSIFLENVIATSLIYIVVLILSMRLMEQKVSASELSIYWFGATTCAFIVQTILSKESKLNTFLRKFDAKFGYLAIIPPFLGLIFSNSIAIITSQLAFSFINPIARNTAKARFYETFGNQEKTIEAYGYRDFCSQIIILFFSLSVPFFYSKVVYVILCFSLPLLVLLRWVFSQNAVLAEEIYDRD